MHSKSYGFSLIELMVVLAIIALLLLKGSVQLDAWQQHQHLWQTTQQLSLFLQRLRNDANGRNREHKLILSKSAGSWAISSHYVPLLTEQSGEHWTFTPHFPAIRLVRSVSRVKYLLRNIDLQEAQGLAETCLNAQTAAKVRQQVAAFMESRGMGGLIRGGR